MQRLWAVAALVLAAGLGAAAALVLDRMGWESELAVQLAEKDRVIAGLQHDLDQLQGGLEALGQTNAAMRTLIATSLRETADVAASNASSLEKLRGVIRRLQALKESVAALETDGP